MLNREPMGMKLDCAALIADLLAVSVLNREPMGMKLNPNRTYEICLSCFSAQPRADGDEALVGSLVRSERSEVSVLNREPMGMKLFGISLGLLLWLLFQCSTASRWG